MATADAFNQPTVDSITTTNYHGVVGDEIIARAEDDFKVTGVKVSIQSAAGALLEQGDAVMQENTIDWLYKATQANAALPGSKITAVASDLPGNNTSLTVTLWKSSAESDRETGEDQSSGLPEMNGKIPTMAICRAQHEPFGRTATHRLCVLRAGMKDPNSGYGVSYL